ncbi:MAG: hypothetical protein VXW43_14480, partial [Pseudomonadota bacterium]|nr:hypothetical protein [Pseudomonadota bacterium]
MDEWRWMTAADLGRGIAAGDIDPEALCEVFLTAIEAHEHRDRIYARVTPDRARAEARAAAIRRRHGSSGVNQRATLVLNTASSAQHRNRCVFCSACMASTD